MKNVRIPSPAMAVACLALALSLGGTGYAVASLPKNSVDTPQLKKNAVVSAKVRNGSLRAADFAVGQLPAGAAGAAGPQGPQGPAGTAGIQGTSGVLFGQTASGGGPNPDGTTRFFAAPMAVTVPSPDARVLVVADNGFGTGVAAAGALNLFICYKQGSGPITTVGNPIAGLRLPPNTRVPMGLSKVLTLAPGQYTVGMCGTGGTGWTNNDWGTTTVLVFTQ